MSFSPQRSRHFVETSLRGVCSSIHLGGDLGKYEIALHVRSAGPCCCRVVIWVFTTEFDRREPAGAIHQRAQHKQIAKSALFSEIGGGIPPRFKSVYANGCGSFAGVTLDYVHEIPSSSGCADCPRSYRLR
jgi:hypothetical protein